MIYVVSERNLRHDFYVRQKRILFLKLRKLRIPKQTRFRTLVLLLQPSQKRLYVFNFRRLDISFISNFLPLELLEGVVGKVVLFGTPLKQGVKILVRVIEPRRTCIGDVSKVFQNLNLQHINIQGILRLSK